MTNNKRLNTAGIEKKAEFYTQYEDIQQELNHYENHFAGKTVLCNCDDPYESNFCKFFLRNFNYLKLKRLICTSYISSPVVGEQMTLFDLMDEPVQRGHGYVMDVCEVPMANGRGVSDDDIERLLKSKKRGVKKLNGNGDFRSEECIEYLKQADIVVTNPPFYLFREYIAQLLKYGKNFIVWGNNNAITYKEFFPLLKNNKVWLGYISNKTCVFRLSDDYTEFDIKETKKKNDGLKYGKVPAISTFTNLDIKKRHERLILFRRYDPNDYPKFINYDAICVNKVTDIPVDYGGLMGVPITFLEKYNPEQFEIIGISLELAMPMKNCVEKGTYMQGGNRFYSKRINDSDRKRGYKYHREYDRIVIRNKNPERKKINED